MSRFEIRCGDVVLGHSNFESADEGMGVRIGRFVPAASYTLFKSRFAEEPQTTETLALPLGIFHSDKRIPTRWVYILYYSADLGVDFGIEVSAHLPVYDSSRDLFETHVN